MKAGPPSVNFVLDDAEAAVARLASPWLGVLWLSALPLRLLQVHFLDRVIEFGASAGEYGTYLGELSLAIAGASLVALYGRAVYVRACGLEIDTGRRPGGRAFVLPAGPFANYLYLSFAIEVLFLLIGLSILPIPVLMLLAGLAAASWEFSGSPGLVGPWRTLFAHSRPLLPILGVVLVVSVAFWVVWINLFFLFHLVLWLGHGVMNTDLGRWRMVLGPDNTTFVLLVAAGAWMLIEPFWLAACVAYARRVRGQSSGSDLAAWFAELSVRDAFARGGGR